MFSEEGCHGGSSSAVWNEFELNTRGLLDPYESQVIIRNGPIGNRGELAGVSPCIVQELLNVLKSAIFGYQDSIGIGNVTANWNKTPYRIEGDLFPGGINHVDRRHIDKTDGVAIGFALDQTGPPHLTTCSRQVDHCNRLPQLFFHKYAQEASGRIGAPSRFVGNQQLYGLGWIFSRKGWARGKTKY